MQSVGMGHKPVFWAPPQTQQVRPETFTYTHNLWNHSLGLTGNRMLKGHQRTRVSQATSSGTGHIYSNAKPKQARWSQNPPVYRKQLSEANKT